MTTEDILLTIIKHKGSCDTILMTTIGEDTLECCRDCIYNVINDEYPDNPELYYCKYEDDSNDLVFKIAIKDYMKIYKDESKLFEALL